MGSRRPAEDIQYLVCVDEIRPYDVVFSLAAAKVFVELSPHARAEVERSCLELARSAPLSRAHPLRVVAAGALALRCTVDLLSRTVCVRAIEDLELPKPVPRVLLVEDDPDLRWSLADQIESAGFAVETAQNGLEALSKLQRGFCADAILLDLIMPVMSGVEFLECREREPQLLRIPTVVVTAHPKFAKGLRVNEVLRKPLDPRRLQAVIRELAERAPARGA